MNRVLVPPTTGLRPMAEAARSASNVLAQLSTAQKNAVLVDLAERLERSAARILEANAADLAAARADGLTGPKLRRLEITPTSLSVMAEGVRQVVELPDPVGRVVKSWTVPSGLDVSKIGCPLGVILMIYESRPNVTIDAFVLCFKAGNACILKGGREARHSNEALGALVQESLARMRVPTAALNVITNSDRDALIQLLQFDDLIHLCIPRGGEALIRFVHEHSRIPTVQHFHGVCHIYVDRAADLGKALEICATAKTSAPATCNSAECLLIDERIADDFLPVLVRRLLADGVEVRADAAVLARVGTEVGSEIGGRVHLASAEDWGREFLDLVVAIKVVAGIDAAISHIERFASGHTEAIVTEDVAAQSSFLQRVQSSCTLVNASTRFNDGFQLGLGAEIGISTSKIHAYGPMGLEELTAQRYVVRGDGQTR